MSYNTEHDECIGHGLGQTARWIWLRRGEAGEAADGRVLAFRPALSTYEIDYAETYFVQYNALRQFSLI